VVVIDDLSTGSEDNIPAGARFERIDIVHEAALAGVVSSVRPTAVCHLAAQASVTASVHSPENDLSVNVRGTFNVLQGAKDVGAPIVFASTGGALYGVGEPIPSPENTSRGRPMPGVNPSPE
jgi:UDP-glucose 4-epimerase